MERTPPARALHWLAQAAPDPDAWLDVWERTDFGVILLPAGRQWDVLLVPGALGRLALPLLDRLAATGPVLADLAEQNIGFLVPVGTAVRWLGTGVRVAGEGSWIPVPHPGRPTRGVHWLIPPDGSGTLIDPMVLELALHDAAARLRSAE